MTQSRPTGDNILLLAKGLARLISGQREIALLLQDNVNVRGCGLAMIRTVARRNAWTNRRSVKSNWWGGRTIP